VRQLLLLHFWYLFIPCGGEHTLSAGAVAAGCRWEALSVHADCCERTFGVHGACAVLVFEVHGRFVVAFRHCVEKRLFLLRVGGAVVVLRGGVKYVVSLMQRAARK
jgi:hypothetical protein